MPGSALAQPERQLVLRRRINGHMTGMRDRARGAATERQAQIAAEEELQRTITESPTLANATASERVFYGVMLAALPTVYINDVMLLGPVAEFLASAGFPEDHPVTRFAPYVVPAMIIGLETIVGAFRMVKYREYLAGDAGAAVHRTLTAFAVLLGLGIPVAGAALYLKAVKVMPDTAIKMAVVFLPITLAIVLSLACHLCILLGARYMHDAKTWLSVTLKCNRLRADQEKKRQAFVRQSTAAADLLPFYLQDLDEYNGTFQPPLAAGPFDNNTRTIVNEVYGYEAIRTAAGPSAPAQPAPTTDAEHAAAQPRPEHANSDAPDWEALYALQQRDDESEVRA